MLVRLATGRLSSWSNLSTLVIEEGDTSAGMRLAHAASGSTLTRTSTCPARFAGASGKEFHAGATRLHRPLLCDREIER